MTPHSSGSVSGSNAGNRARLLELVALVDEQRRVAAVVDDEIRTAAVRPDQRLVRAPPVLGQRLALPGEDRDAARLGCGAAAAGSADGDGGRGVVLGREDVARDPAHVGAERGQRLDEHRGLDGHVQAAHDLRAGEGLPAGVLAPDGHQARHLLFGEADFVTAMLGEPEVGHLERGAAGGDGLVERVNGCSNRGGHSSTPSNARVRVGEARDDPAPPNPSLYRVPAAGVRNVAVVRNASPVRRCPRAGPRESSPGLRCPPARPWWRSAIVAAQTERTVIDTTLSGFAARQPERRRHGTKRRKRQFRQCPNGRSGVRAASGASGGAWAGPTTRRRRPLRPAATTRRPARARPAAHEGSAGSSRRAAWR